ncbi:serine hydrolase [Aureibacter tunicatorum]|uniref:CubicO group peptidase (Beta-lactamase class C family) n=1 Tax=Aureibacter tunicatorum TaxID=866807 RepID=A0AAE4BTX1_9BACT|nr:serine hydrolase [Aureibacter tunicatorum]MDR6240102.1 CubicO group peptidase (beta-lactamase class C family) [Aureibacter tunicatorum]BDD04573.1 hypothetical protein AUTU_20560 [Aureibacter tunicatorum]
MRFSILFLAITATFFCCKSKATKEVKTQDQYALKLDSLMTIAYERDLFNGNVLVSRHGKIIYQNSFGYVDNKQNKLLHQHSIFNVGSIIKEVNGVAVMMLTEKGLLSLDDPISKFNLKLPAWSEKVKVSHLLNYASGVPCIDTMDSIDDKKAWEIIRGTDTLLFEAGSKFKYDNANVFLQRRIIENVTGQNFEAFVTENIVKPLGMKNSTFDPQENYPERASCFDFNKQKCPEMRFISGWLWLDIHDLHKWITALNTEQLISKSSFEQLLKNPYAPEKSSSLGEYFDDMQLHKHNGISFNFESIFFNDIKNDVVIILVSNQRNQVWDLGHLAHDIILDKEIKYPQKSIYRAIRNESMNNIELGLKKYNDIKNKDSNLYAFDNPSELNKLGYDLIGANKIQDALKVFDLAIREFPENSNLYDSYGEAFYLDKQFEASLENYQKSLELDPKNKNAEEMIEKIKKAKLQ